MGSRSHVVSSFTVIKGAMIDETYRVFAAWDFGQSKRANLDRLRDLNSIGASSGTWLRDVAKVVNRRFDPAGRDKALVILARSGFPVHEWRALLLWHITRDEFLLRDFLVSWLFSAFEGGAFRLRPEDLDDYLAGIGARGGATEHEWSQATSDRVATGLLKMASDFGLLRGGVAKEFEQYHLPERSFLYLLHAMHDALGNAGKIVSAPDWRMYLMRPADVEHELLHLHQYRKIEYHAVGSLIQLKLPCDSALEFAESIAV